MRKRAKGFHWLVGLTAQKPNIRAFGLFGKNLIKFCRIQPIHLNKRSYRRLPAGLNLVKVSKPAVDGHTIISTLDVNVQERVEKKVDEFL